MNTLQPARSQNPRPYLRLVAPSVRHAEHGLDADWSPVLRLGSVAAVGKHILSSKALAHLLDSLDVRHALEVRHEIFTNSGRPRRYRLSIHSNAKGDQLAQCASALRIACPMMGWEPADANWREVGAKFVNFQTTLLPAPVRAFPGPDGGEPVRLPSPGDLPNWRLTEILNASLALPDYVQLCVRLAPFRLAPKDCEQIWRVLQQLRANFCKVAYPGVEPSPFAASDTLKAEMVTLLQAWLTQPSGYALSMQLVASSEMDSVAVAHIARDVFGDRPFEASLNPTDDARALGFPHAIRFDQGLPGLLPEERHAAALGVRRHFPDAAAQLPHAGLQIGQVADKAGGSPVYLPPTLRSRHVALVGGSGTGKSSLMLNMILSDLQDPGRPGVVLIDPHGDLYQAVLNGVPEERRADVVLVNVTDMAYSACINPMAMGHDNPARMAYINNQIMELIDVLFEVEHSRGPMTTSYLRALLDLAGSYPGRAGTFLDCMRLLREPAFTDWLVEKLKASRPEAVAHWTMLQKTRGEQHLDNWVPFLAARLTPFTGSPIMKRLLCRPDPTVDFQAIFRERKIVLFNFSKSVLQDVEARIACGLTLTQLFGASLARAHMPAQERFPVHLYVDEFQSIATASTGKMLAEARKFNLGLTVAFQNLGQLKSRFSGELTGTLLGNTATKLLFRLSPGDALMLDDYYKPHLDVADMTGLQDFHAACVMPGQGSQSAAFVMRCMPPPQAPVDQSDMANFPHGARGTPVSAANQELLKLYEIPLSSLEHG